MGKHIGTGRSDLLEWQICEDEEAWEASQEKQHAGTQNSAVDTSQKQPSSLPHWWQKWGLVLAAITLLVFAARLAWVGTQQELATIESEVQNAVELDARAMDVGTVDMWGVEYPARQEVALAGTQEAEIVALGNGWARVRVTVQGEDEGIYRQTRVYQELDGQQGAKWVRVPPTISHWGRPRQWESTYFHFHYFSQDEAAVKAAAPKLDALYPTFYAVLMAGDPPGKKVAEKIIVEVDPMATIVPGNGATSAEDASLILPSPSATLAPVEVSEESLLVQGVALALFNRLAAQSDTFYQLPKGRKLLLSGLRLWLIWNQELPLASWREPLVRWVFSADEGVPVPMKGVRVPAFAHDFCAHHHLWLSSETEIDAPIFCIQHVTDREAFLAFRYTPLPLMLSYLVGQEDLLAHGAASVTIEPPLPMASAVVFATLFEYISVRYGAGQSGADGVAALIAALPHHQGWETLIPAIFGISRPDFEVGWNAFLAERYGIAP